MKTSKLIKKEKSGDYYEYDACAPTAMTFFKQEMAMMHADGAVKQFPIKAVTATKAHVNAAPIAKVFIDDLTETATTQQRTWRVPWFIIWTCFLQLTLYAIANECIQQRFMFMPEHRREYWRYVTYMLLHSDRSHLLLNVTLQCLIGFSLECEQGHWKLASIYIVGGISGSLATARLQPQLSLLGASAGVYAMLLSHLPHLVKNFSHLPHRYLRVVALIIFCLSDIGFTSFHLLVNRNANPRICLEAHIAGGIAGLLLGFLVYRKIAVGHRRLWRQCVRA